METDAKVGIFTCLGRGLGDAVVFAKVATEFEIDLKCKLVLIGKQANLSLCQSLGLRADYYEAPFPASTGRDMTIAGMLRLCKTAFRIRKLKIDFGLNVFPDFREQGILFLVRPKRQVEVEYSVNHSVKLQTRQLWRSTGVSKVESGITAYETYRRLFRFVQAESGMEETQSGNVHRHLYRGTQAKIAVFPCAGQPCREWPTALWGSLVEAMVRQGLEVSVFARDAFEANSIIFKDKDTGASSKAILAAVQDLPRILKDYNIVVCHESLAAHLAYFLTIPAIIVTGPGDNKYWLEWGTQVGADGGCKYYPCFNRPKCLGQNEFACIKAVTVEAVLSAILPELRRIGQ